MPPGIKSPLWGVSSWYGLCLHLLYCRWRKVRTVQPVKAKGTSRQSLRACGRHRQDWWLIMTTKTKNEIASVTFDIKLILLYQLFWITVSKGSQSIIAGKLWSCSWRQQHVEGMPSIMANQETKAWLQPSKGYR